MASIESLVSRFRQVSGQGADSTAELEVRFEQVEYPFFEDLYRKALDPERFSWEHSQTLNTIRNESKRGGKKSEQLVWERRFLPGGGRENHYYSKSRLTQPVRVRPAPGVPGYKVALSLERKVAEFGLDEVRFRVKNRVSFTPRPAAESDEDSDLVAALQGWRLDLTLVRELSGSSADSLPGVVREAFGLPGGPGSGGTTRQTPENLLSEAGLAAGGGRSTADLQATRRLYTYEAELEYVGAPGDLSPHNVQEAIEAVLRLSNPGYQTAARVQAELREVASYVLSSPALLQKFATGEWGLKNLTPQAVGLTRTQYAQIYPPLGYFLTDKAHGLHALAVVREGRLTVVAPGLNPPLLEFPRKGGDRPSVVDGELVPVSAPAGEAAEGEPPADRAGAGYRFLAFDVLVLQGTNLAGKPFEERVDKLTAAAAELAAHGLETAAKPFVRLTSSNPQDLKAQFEGMYRRAGREYEIDGLVLYEPSSSYTRTRVYKWKPFEENTNDFLVRRPPDSVLGRHPFVDRPGHRLYFLFVGISQEAFERFGLAHCPGYREMFPRGRTGGYFPVQFQPSDQPYAYLYQHPLPGSAGGAAPLPEEIENHICEFRLRSPEGADGGDGEGPAPDWELVRVRLDRDEDLERGRLFGNDFRSAELNWLNYRDPFTLEMLYGGAGGDYFAAEKSGIYRAPTAFISYAKSCLMEANLGGLDYVVDLGAGKGQDLGRYRRVQIKAVVMVDSSRNALSELVRRKHEPAGGRRGGPGGGRTRFHVLRADFSAPHREVAETVRKIPDFPREGASAVVSNLAAHYAFSSREGVSNFAGLVQDLVRPGGQVQLLLLDGARILALFRENKIALGETWDVREGGAPKYSIRRLFGENRLAPGGQKVGMLLPFSRGEYYEEYLSNIDEITRAFKARGFALVERRDLWESYGEGFSSQKRHHGSLTEGDKKWLSLFVAVRYERAA